MSRLAPPALVATLALLSCGDAADGFVVHGAIVSVATDAPFALRPDLRERLERTLAVALGYWGGSWDVLAGRRIAVVEGPWVPCGGTARATGCWDGGIVVSASDPGAGHHRCIEQTVLVHEVGHAVIGDPLHRDPRWMQFEPVREALAGGTGYGRDGDGACELATSVWRHPPDAP